MRGPARKALLALLVAGVAVLGAPSAAPSSSATLDTLVAHDWTFAATQLAADAQTLATNRYPEYTTSSGAWSTTSASGWASGFLPGQFWLMYQKTGDPTWRTRAETWQAGVEQQKNDTSTHDVGFQIFSSFGNGYRLVGNDAWRQVILTAAGSLATRYSSIVGCIKSWNGPTSSDFRVIIDNMMNLELLLWASQHGGQSAWSDMSVSHSLKTRQNNVRADGSTYQVIDYDPTTGAIKSFQTADGYSADSTWSRGQAWGLYGFTMVYRYTHDARFLGTAQTLADYFLAHLPSDYVPYWDFALPSTQGQPRDSSAAAIAASGLLELSQLETDTTRSATYLTAAENILTSLSTSYLAEGTANKAILVHGTYSVPAGISDGGLSWGDYYFLEALLRYEAIAHPATAPGAPTLGSATAGAGQVTLHWTAPTSDGGSPVTGYQIYRGTAGSGTETLLTTVGNQTSYVDGGLTNGNTYWYEVAAVNGVGPGARSNEASATPASASTVPGAPTGLTAAPAKRKGIMLSWAAPATDGGSAITGYRIYRSTTSGFTPGPSTLLTAVTARSYKDTSTSRGTTYYYRVSAVNAVGESAPSAQAGATAR